MDLGPIDIFHCVPFSANIYAKLVCVDAAPSELFAFSPGPGFSRLPLSLSLCDWKWMRVRPRPPSSFVCFVLLGKSLTFGQDLFARKTTPGATDPPLRGGLAAPRTSGSPDENERRMGAQSAVSVVNRRKKVRRGGDAAHL